MLGTRRKLGRGIRSSWEGGQDGQHKIFVNTEQKKLTSLSFSALILLLLFVFSPLLSYYISSSFIPCFTSLFYFSLFISFLYFFFSFLSHFPHFCSSSLLSHLITFQFLLFSVFLRYFIFYFFFSLVPPLPPSLAPRVVSLLFLSYIPSSFISCFISLFLFFFLISFFHSIFLLFLLLELLYPILPLSSSIASSCFLSFHYIPHFPLLFLPYVFSFPSISPFPLRSLHHVFFPFSSYFIIPSILYLCCPSISFALSLVSLSTLFSLPSSLIIHEVERLTQHYVKAKKSNAHTTE